jgi:hypothetical protein
MNEIKTKPFASLSVPRGCTTHATGETHQAGMNHQRLGLVVSSDRSCSGNKKRGERRDFCLLPNPNKFRCLGLDGGDVLATLGPLIALVAHDGSQCQNVVPSVALIRNCQNFAPVCHSACDFPARCGMELLAFIFT